MRDEREGKNARVCVQADAVYTGGCVCVFVRDREKECVYVRRAVACRTGSCTRCSCSSVRSGKKHTRAVYLKSNSCCARIINVLLIIKTSLC